MENNHLGYNIEGKYPIKKALKSLKEGELGIANGRARVWTPIR